MKMNLGRFKRPLIYGAGVLALVCAVACGGTPTGASPTTTETFTGSVGVSSAAVFAFTVGQTGQVIMTTTSLAPQSSAGIELGLGQVSSGTCYLQFYQDLYVGQPVTFDDIPAGPYCGEIADIGFFTETNNYTVTVAHP